MFRRFGTILRGLKGNRLDIFLFLFSFYFLYGELTSYSLLFISLLMGLRILLPRVNTRTTYPFVIFLLVHLIMDYGTISSTEGAVYLIFSLAILKSLEKKNSRDHFIKNLLLILLVSSWALFSQTLGLTIVSLVSFLFILVDVRRTLFHENINFGKALAF